MKDTDSITQVVLNELKVYSLLKQSATENGYLTELKAVFKWRGFIIIRALAKAISRILWVLLGKPFLRIQFMMIIPVQTFLHLPHLIETYETAYSIFECLFTFMGFLLREQGYAVHNLFNLI
jgi:hypothetical protein